MQIRCPQPIRDGIMQHEIERKFLLSQEQFDRLQFLSCAVLEITYEILQGYIVNKEDLDIRVRIDRRVGNKTRPPIAILAIKKPVDDSFLVRTEDQYEIPLENALDILDPLPKIYKTRYRFGEYTIDAFEKDLEGLFIVEKEYESVEDALNDPIPHWVGDEVTELGTYKNSNLVGKKFKNGLLI